MGARIRGRVLSVGAIGGTVVGFNVCSSIVADMVVEIFSDLNQHCTRVELGIPNPTPEQLARHYVNFGGLRSFIDKQTTPTLSQY